MSQNLRDRIWFTAHIRMASEHRLQITSRFLSYLTIWYSTVLTCLTVYQLIAVKNTIRDVTSAALAVVLLALSIFIPSLKLDQQADKFRECYLRLQRLLDTCTEVDVLKRGYYDILDSYPNHLPRDYSDFVVSSRLLGQKLTDGQNPVLPTLHMWLGYLRRRLFYLVITVVAMLAPGLLYFLL